VAKDPAFLFYPNDWLGGTMGMTFEEKGAYMELLMLQFNRGHMTSHMIGQVVGQLWVNIADKFVEDDVGLYYNVRLEEEQIKRKEYTDSRNNNKNGTNQYTKKENKKGGHMTCHMEDVNENEIEDEFETFWRVYDKKVGNKEKLLSKWKKLKEVEKDRIFATVQKYVLSTEKKYRKNPETYLNNKSWEDEIITPQPKKQVGTTQADMDQILINKRNKLLNAGN